MVASEIEETHMTSAYDAGSTRGKDRTAARTKIVHFENSEPVSFMPRAIGDPRAWLAALIFLASHLGRYAFAIAAELRARRAIEYLRSLDDDRLLDLGIKRRQDIDRFVRSRNE